MTDFGVEIDAEELDLIISTLERYEGLISAIEIDNTKITAIVLRIHKRYGQFKKIMTMQTETRQFSFLTILFVAFTCIFSGGFIGAITNMINGSVSPFYFQAIMNWDFSNIWAASVAQGIFEGLLYGVIFSIIFTTSFGFITKGLAPYSFALRQLLKIIGIVFICWIIGGLLAMFLATLSPDFYKSHFPLTPIDKIGMIKFAWVGGSIWGGMIGGFLSAILGVVVIKNSWRKHLMTE